MTCPDCQAADADPRHACYRADCRGCRARMLAHSPLFFECARVGRLSQAYRDALALDGISHDEVKAASVRLKGAAA